MAETCVNHFNNFLKGFVENIMECFPEYKDVLENYYGELLENTSSDDKYVKRFMKKTLEFKDLITKRDESLFDNDIYFLKNVNFKDLWNKENIGDNNKTKIWDHIQHLYLLGSAMVGDSQQLIDFVESVKKDDTKNDKNDTNDKNDNNDKTDEHDENGHQNELMDIFKSIKDNKGSDITDNIPESIFSEGLIGNLAKELADDINVNDLDLDMPKDGNVNDLFTNIMSGDNPSKFMNLLTSVGQKIQNKVSEGDLDESKLVNEANTLMESLQGSNPILKNLMNMSKQQQSRFNQEMDKTDRQNSTKDRLRKKLKQRNENKK